MGIINYIKKKRAHKKRLEWLVNYALWYAEMTKGKSVGK